jgi:hypothetical protein
MADDPIKTIDFSSDFTVIEKPGTTGEYSITLVSPYPGTPALNQLSNVTITTPVAGQVLKWNGTRWVNGADATGGTGGSSSMSTLTDVTITTPAVGQVIKWDGTKWVNGTDNSATNLDSLTDVVVAAPTTGQMLQYNGTNWVNTTVTLGGGASNLDALTDVTLTSPAAGQVLKFNGSQWVNDVDATGSGSGGGATTASELAFTPVGNIAATNVQGALAELDSEKSPTTHNHALGSLTGVQTVGATSGQVLAYNGTQWINTSLSIPTNLDALTDVTVSTPSNGQVLKYNGSQWVNAADSVGVTGTGITAIVALTQSAYDALGTKSTTTLYVING